MQTRNLIQSSVLSYFEEYFIFSFNRGTQKCKIFPTATRLKVLNFAATIGRSSNKVTENIFLKPNTGSQINH